MYSQDHKTPIVFQNQKSYDSHLIMQELRKFNFKINVIPNGLEKNMIINNKTKNLNLFTWC